MYCTVPLLIAALLYDKAFAVTLTATTTDVNDGDTVTLTCTTTDFADNIVFKLDGSDKLFCIANLACPTGTYSGSRSGSTQTILTFSFLSSRDSGDWTCSYGSTASSPLPLPQPPTSNDGDSGLSGGEIAAISCSTVVFVYTTLLVIELVLYLNILRENWKDLTTTEKVIHILQIVRILCLIYEKCNEDCDEPNGGTLPEPKTNGNPEAGANSENPPEQKKKKKKKRKEQDKNETV